MNIYRTEFRAMNNKSDQFNYDGNPDAKKVVTRSGPAGLLLVFYITASILGLIALGLWWLLT
jgi:hypothetical protein